jgi:hypothetical protein
MRAPLVALSLALAACTLDPRQVIAEAALRVQVQGIPSGGATLVVTARDADGKQLVKRAPLSGQTTVELVYEKGTLTDGALDLGGVVLGADGAQLACGAAQGEGTGSTVTLSLALANDDANCGACGRTCDPAPHATRTCVRATASCGPLQCESGWFDVNLDPLDGCETTCAAPSPENTTTSCRDGTDDDCDSKQDCADDGCQGLTRPCSFMACTGIQTWDCATDTWGACTANGGLESSVASCTDGLDNDCDGQRDCDDEGCNGLSQACTQSTCSGVQQWTCATNTWSACAIDGSLEATTQTCSDGLDNDCDGKTDCQDPACLEIKQGCGGNLCVSGIKTWLCSAQLYSLCVPYISLPESSGLTCGDGLDNDCDQKTDCADNECLGKGCGLGKVCCANGTCASRCP